MEEGSIVKSIRSKVINRLTAEEIFAFKLACPIVLDAGCGTGTLQKSCNLPEKIFEKILLRRD